jgi:FlgD Ig-like domain
MDIMRRFQWAMLATAVSFLLTATARAQTPALLWAKQFNGGGFPAASALALRSPNLWVGGSFATSIDLGGATYGSPLNTFLASFTTDGAYQWSHAFNLGSGGVITAMGADSGNNIYITGLFSGSVDFGAGPVASLGSTDIFLAKFNSTGVLQWSKRFGDAASDAGLALAIDIANNVIIGGRFAGTTDFGAGGLTTAGGSDAFIAKFTGAGAHVWSERFGDVSSQQVDALASINNDVYATGSYFGTINLGGSDLTSLGLTDIFLARLNSSGVHQWSKRFGDASSQSAVDIDVDATSVYLLANIQGSVNFGGSILVSAGSQDIAIARFTNAGVHMWSERFGDSDVQTGTALDVFGSSLVVTGYFESSINFGHPLWAGSSFSDGFVARLLSTDGAETWSQHFGFSFNSDYGLDVVTDGAATYLGGRFDKDIDLGYNGTLFSPDHTSEAYLAKFASLPAEPTLRQILDVPNDQGGRVRIRIDGSAYDALTTPLPIRNYEVYLREDPLNAVARGAAAFGETWVLAGGVPAHAQPTYLTIALTEQDSTLATGMHISVFKARATTDDPSLYFDSLPVSGYSWDNLAPAIPLNFVIHDAELSWHASGDADIAYYSVYGSAGAFNATAELIDYTTTTRMDVSRRSFAHYYVTATDHSGNEGKPASLDASRAGTNAPPRTLSVSAYPNPFNPSTTIRYTLPASGRARIDVFDASGARVRALVNREQPAGVFTAHWDGRDDAGRRAASGIYFARIEHNGAARAYKLVVLK